MYYFSTVILVLLNLYCYASPIPSVDQNQDEQPGLLTNAIAEESAMMKPIISNTNHQLKLHEFNYLKMLCELYRNCNDNDDEQIIDYNDIKYKRLSSSLFHGIPKFGKRAFSSAFAGIPKFG